jgi:hypothetical protein
MIPPNAPQAGASMAEAPAYPPASNLLVRYGSTVMSL